VGYRVRSPRGAQFRRWATERLSEYLVKGFTMDDERLKHPPVEGSGVPDYFDELLERIRDIRASEKRMYLRVREIFALAGDYDPAKKETAGFFQTIQNKLHFASAGQTAPELIAGRADHRKSNMGLTAWKGDAVRKADVTVAKNYLNEDEIRELNRIVTMWLDFAEDQARRRKQVFLKDWKAKLDEFLRFKGVYKSLQMTEEHFRALYANAPFEFFLYDSSKLGQVRNFATSPHIHRLDAVDAYERQLVKQIEVASLEVAGGHNKPYVRLVAAGNKRGVISARVEVDVQRPTGVRREEVPVQDGDDLEQVTGRALYADCRIGEIRVGQGKELLEVRVPGREHWLEPGQAVGGVDADVLKRQMIRRTIREHLDKERRLRPRGIKVLSLFFIDVVEHYRIYSADGQPQKGKYALMFEEEYRRLAKHPDYQTLFPEVDLDSDAAEVHNGYFSIDKKGAWTDTAENNQGNRDNAERAYNLIMKDKEKLLSFETKLKFIFSHSALREGWDNPNVTAPSASAGRRSAVGCACA
jgi:hypothetical protein